MPDQPASPYVPVRALARGLSILRALSRGGPASPAELAGLTGIDRTTVYRLLETLQREGVVTRNAHEHAYALAPAVRELSDGFTDTDMMAQAVGPELGALLAEVKWPSDFATFDAGRMVIRESTHRFSPYSPFRTMIGRRHPVLQSALGRAVIGSVGASERAELIALMTSDGAEIPTGYVEMIVEDFRTHGYAQSVDGAAKGISAIALPVRAPSIVLGALNIAFYTSAMTPREAARRYLEPLRDTVARIEARLIDTDREQADLIPR